MNPTTWSDAEAFLVQDVLESNLQHLSAGKETFQEVKDATATGEVVTLPDGSLALSRTGSLFGLRSELGFPNARLEKIKPSSETVYVVFGFGTGHAVRELRRRTSGPIVVFDPDPSLLRTALEFAPTDIEDVALCCSFDDLRTNWGQLCRGNAQTTLISESGYRELFPDQYLALRDALTTLQAVAKVNHNTLHLRARSWVDNVLSNIDKLEGTTPFGALEGAYRGVPAFLVSAGPSANKNAHLLREAAKKGLVFVVNSSASILAHHEVEPHLLVILEAVDQSRQTRDLPWLDRIHRALSVSASPAVWEQRCGPILPFYENTRFFTDLASLVGYGGIDVAGSVSTAALSLAEVLGCSPIVYVGQDLAFTDGMVHAKHTEIEDSRVKVDRDSGRIIYDWCASARRIFSEVHGAPTGERLSEVTAWGGHGTVTSSALWDMVRGWLESKALLLAASGSDTRLVNATEGGSRIPGFEEVRLAELLAGLPSTGPTCEEFRAEMARRAAPIQRESITTWVEDHFERVQDFQVATRQLLDTSVNALASLDGAPSDVSRAYDAVAHAEHALGQAAKREPLLDAWCQEGIDNIVGQRGSQSPADSLQDARQGLDTEIAVARLLGDAAGELASKLKGSARV